MSSIANIFEQYRYIFFSTLQIKKNQYINVYICSYMMMELIKFKSILVLLRQILLKDAVYSTVLLLLLTPNNQFLIIPDTIYKGGPSLIQNVGPFKIVTYY